MARMRTKQIIAVGQHKWDDGSTARIERNNAVFFWGDSEVSVSNVLRFCKRGSEGQFNRVHLVITEDDFISLFRDAVSNRVFASETLHSMQKIIMEFFKNS